MKVEHLIRGIKAEQRQFEAFVYGYELGRKDAEDGKRYDEYEGFKSRLESKFHARRDE